MGLEEGVRAALAQGFKSIIIEGDNLAVINAIKKIWSIPWEILNIIFDVDLELRSFSSFKIIHIFREANRATDFMASHGHRNYSLVYHFPPFEVDFSLIIHKDVLGWSRTKGVCLSFSFRINIYTHQCTLSNFLLSSSSSRQCFDNGNIISPFHLSSDFCNSISFFSSKVSSSYRSNLHAWIIAA